MNILIVVPWDQTVGGVQQVVGNLARYLQNHNHNVIFLNPGDTNLLKKKTTTWGFQGFELNWRGPFYKNSPIRSILTFLIFFPITLGQLISLIRKNQIQIINIHYPLSSSLYFAICRWLLAVKLVISVHGADFFPKGQRLRKYRWGIRLLLLSSDAIVAPSKAYLEDFLSLFPHLRERGTFIHNGLDLNKVAQQGNGRDGNQEKYLLCVATHNEKKGLDVLLKTIALLTETDHRLKLLLVGDGPLRGRYEELAKEIGIEDRVEFLGQKEHSETVRLLCGCEVFVLPSRAEPFGVVIIEAMACRKPVVASAVGGIPEIIEHGKSGILVEPDNPKVLAAAIRSLLNNDSLRRSLAANGYKRVTEHFRCGNTGAKYESLYSHLLGRAPNLNAWTA